MFKSARIDPDPEYHLGRNGMNGISQTFPEPDKEISLDDDVEEEPTFKVKKN